MAITPSNTVEEWRVAFNALDSDVATILTSGEINLGSYWRIYDSSDTLYFEYNGTNVASLSSTGELTIAGDIKILGTV